MDLPPSLIHELLFLLEDLQADVQWTASTKEETRVEWGDLYGARLSIAVKSLEKLLIERKENHG